MSFVMDKEVKCKHFEGGLRTAIRVPVTTSANCFDFSKLVEVAMHIERELDEDKNSSKEKRLDTKMGVVKRGYEGFGKQAKFGFGCGSHWIDDKEVLWVW